MRDLHNYIVKQYAVYWERLGLELGLKKHDTDNISANNAHNPRRVQECCIMVLEQWLTETPSPTWAALDGAIRKITSPMSTEKRGNQEYISCSLVVIYYYQEFIINLLFIICSYHYIS